MAATIEINDLVKFNNVLWRAITNEDAYKRIEIINPFTNHTTYEYTATLEKLDAPLPEIPTKPTLVERQSMLIQSLHKTYSLLSRRDSIAAEETARLYNKINRHNNPETAWFWGSVTLSKTDPRKIAYATQPNYVDYEPKRKFCSITKFLQNAAAKNGFVVAADIVPIIAKAFGDISILNYEMTAVLAKGVKLIDTYRNGPRSCMSDQEYIKWYTSNPDKVNILRILHGDKLVGRALVWFTDQGKTVLDRIYPSDGGPIVQFALEYAKQQGWLTRANDALDRLTVTMKRDKRLKFPYLDTFKHTNDDPKTAEQIVLNSYRGHIRFEDTAGGWMGKVPITYNCSYCNDAFTEDEVYSILIDGVNTRICCTCFRENYSECQYCYNYQLTENLIQSLNRRYCTQCATARGLI